MKQNGIYVESEQPKDVKFFYRLCPSESIDGGVAVECVDKDGDRISLLCRISTEKGIQLYRDVDEDLGFNLDLEDGTVIVNEEATS